MESSDSASSLITNSTLISLNDLVATEGIDPRRVDNLEKDVTAVGGFYSPIQVIRLDDGRYAVIDGTTRNGVLQRQESSLAWIQTHDVVDLRLATWLITTSADMASCLIEEMYEVDQQTFERVADKRGGVVAKLGETERFFTFPNMLDLADRLELQHRVVEALIAASGGRPLERHEDDIRYNGSGWWRTPTALGSILLVFPRLSAEDFFEIVRRGLRVPAAATRFLIPKLRLVDRPIPLELLAQPLSDDVCAELEHLLSDRQKVIDVPQPRIDEPDTVQDEGDPVTPLLPIPPLLARFLDLPNNCHLFIKDETVIGSSKARVARRLLAEAAADGRLGPGTEVVLPSSGSTALALALETRRRNLELTVFVPEAIAAGKLNALQWHRHVAVIRIPGSSEDARRAAEEYVAANKRTRHVWLADQYADPAAARAHALTTAPEILIQTSASVTHVIAGMGTGATTTGLATVFSRLGVHVIGVQPAAAKHLLPGLKHLPSLPVALVPKNARPELLSSIAYIEDEEGMAFMRMMIRHGLRFGPSTGAVLAAAVRVAAHLAGRPATIVLIGHDSADLYEPLGEVTQ